MPIDEKYNCFDLVAVNTLRKVVIELKLSTYSLDPTPLSVFKTVFNNVYQDILAIVNYFLHLGVFPTDLNTTLVTLF